MHMHMHMRLATVGSWMSLCGWACAESSSALFSNTRYHAVSKFAHSLLSLCEQRVKTKRVMSTHPTPPHLVSSLLDETGGHHRTPLAKEEAEAQDATARPLAALYFN